MTKGFNSASNHVLVRPGIKAGPHTHVTVKQQQQVISTRWQPSGTAFHYKLSERRGGDQRALPLTYGNDGSSTRARTDVKAESQKQQVLRISNALATASLATVAPHVETRILGQRHSQLLNSRRAKLAIVKTGITIPRNAPKVICGIGKMQWHVSPNGATTLVVCVALMPCGGRGRGSVQPPLEKKINTQCGFQVPDAITGNVAFDSQAQKN